VQDVYSIILLCTCKLLNLKVHVCTPKSVYYGIVFLELEGSDLRNSLKQLNDEGWNFDKQSLNQNRCLSPEDLVPLLNLKSQQSVPYFKVLNNYLKRIIKPEPILELVEVVVKSPTGETQLMSSTSSDNNLIVIELIDQAIASNLPQVG